MYVVHLQRILAWMFPRRLRLARRRGNRTQVQRERICCDTARASLAVARNAQLARHPVPLVGERMLVSKSALGVELVARAAGVTIAHARDASRRVQVAIQDIVRLVLVARGIETIEGQLVMFADFVVCTARQRVRERLLQTSR